MNALHYILLGLSALITACQFVATNFPQYAALAHGIAGVAASIMPMLGALSPQLGQAPAAPGALAAKVETSTAAVAAELKAPVAQ